MNPFPRLFEPIAIGSIGLKNRLVMPAMATNFASPEGLVTDTLRNYYEARAKGGVGLIVVENASVDSAGGKRSGRLSVDGAITLPGLRGLAGAIERHGAVAALQLQHAGSQAEPVDGLPPIGPSTVFASSNIAAREASVEELENVAVRFGEAAAIAREAGFQGLEIHSAHNYLIAQFLSSAFNKRSDDYGGTLANRACLLIEVLTAIRRKVGRECALWCRLNGAEYGIQGGLTVAESQQIARMVEPLVDAIHVSAYGFGERTRVQYPETPGGLLHLSKAMKAATRVPVIAVGKLTPEVGEEALQRGQADLIAVGRQLIADPEMPNKIREGRQADVRACTACFGCMGSRRGPNGRLRCPVNASVGREGEAGGNR